MFVTGVSKFSKTSLFSALNHLTDLSASPRYTTLCGYTHEEVEKYLTPSIQELARETKRNVQEVMNKLAQWYDGYSWDAKNFLFTPYSLFSALMHKKVSNYWFQTGTPSFLIRTLRDKDKYDVDNKIVSPAIFDELYPEKLHPISLLFQSGYLTLKEEISNDQWRVGFPNREVKDSLLTSL